MKYLRINLARLTASRFRLTKRRRMIFDRTDDTSFVFAPIFARRSRACVSGFSRGGGPLPPNLRIALGAGVYKYSNYSWQSMIFVLATLLVHFAHILVQRNHFNNIIELLKSDPTSGFIYHLAKTNLFKIFLNRFHSDFVSPFIQWSCALPRFN